MLRRLFRGSGPRQAEWNGKVLARADETIVVDGYEYFAHDAVAWSLLVPSSRTTVCPWKGVASYYDVVDGDRRLDAAAWTYQAPTPAAEHIRGHVAFWRGVKVSAASSDS